MNSQQPTARFGGPGASPAKERKVRMSLQTVKELTKEAGWGTLPTTDGEKVGCRHW
jgi:hypothetical protein